MLRVNVFVSHHWHGAAPISTAARRLLLLDHEYQTGLGNEDTKCAESTP